MSYISAVIAAAIVVALLPLNCAYADYENPKVTSIAQMQTDNSLRISSLREYVFDQNYSLVAIPISGTTWDSELSVESVRLIQIGDSGDVIRNWWNVDNVAFQPAWRDLLKETKGLTADVRKAETEATKALDEGRGATDYFTIPKGDAFSFDKRRGMIYVFLTPTSLNTIIEYNYKITNAATVYDDCAELYWDYVSPELKVASSDVKAQIQLPVPDNTEIVLGDTIRAWGHGPEGTVKVEADGTIDYRVEKVAKGQYAQARIIFPVKWLTNIPVLEKLKGNGLRKDSAIYGESSWIDSYMAGVINFYRLQAIEFFVCIVLLVIAIVLYRKFGREKYDDSIDVSSEISDLCEREPAILGRLLRANHWDAGDVATSLVSLSQKGVIYIEDNSAKNSEDNIRFKITPKAKLSNLSPLERITMKLIFEEAGEGYQSVSLEEISMACRKKKSEINTVLKEWQEQLDKDVFESKLFDENSKKIAIKMGIFAVIAGLVGALEWYYTDFEIPGVALFLTACAIGAIAYNIPRHTPYGRALLKECTEGHDCPTSCLALRPKYWEKSLTRALEGATQVS